MQRDVWLITGIPGVGKSTTARLLAECLGYGAHIEGDRLQELVVAGRVLPGEEPRDESIRQILLCQRNQCLLARSFCEADIVPVLDYVVPFRSRLADYQRHLDGLDLHVVVLAPGQETALARDQRRMEKQVAHLWVQLEAHFVRELTGIGFWIDTTARSPEDTVHAILQNHARARL